MNRRRFLSVAGGVVLAAGGAGYLLSDRKNIVRADIASDLSDKPLPKPDEREILYFSSLAPSGHNTQPWWVKYIEPYHWVICNDKTKWLPAVDPTQRETILSIGAFTQNLEYAAGNAGYNCQFRTLAQSNQDVEVVEVTLGKAGSAAAFDINRIKNRRTVRSNYLSDTLKKEDADHLMSAEQEFFYFIPNSAKEYAYLNEQTIEANRIQAYRDAAQSELADWVRFSSKDAAARRDGLTTATMEIEGLPGWFVRNFYNKTSVMQNSFRDQTIDKVKTQVTQSAGWLLVTSPDNSTATLLETGRRMQRLFLKVREKGIAVHPMTQALEEPSIKDSVYQSLALGDEIQFVLRLGYLKEYPAPVSLRRPVDRFVVSV
ncbi:MAG: nitroreductase [Acidobacteriota bacterium]